MTCEDCGVKVKSQRGMDQHRRAKHPAATTNVEAVERTLKELHRMGRLEDVDAARIQAVRTMALSLDLKPFNSQMFHEYLAALEELTADGDSDGSVEELLRELSA